MFLFNCGVCGFDVGFYGSCYDFSLSTCWVSMLEFGVYVIDILRLVRYVKGLMVGLFYVRSFLEFVFLRVSVLCLGDYVLRSDPMVCVIVMLGFV